MNRDKLTRIVKQLHERTQSGRLSWKETGNPEEFVVNFPQMSVVLSEADMDEKGRFKISIFNDEGRLLSEITDHALDVGGDENHYPSFSNMMREIFDSARNQALGVDDKLDKLIDVLEHS